MDPDRREDSASRGEQRVAYLLSQYPGVSHTFFFNEIVELRRRGLQIETASINPASPPDDGFSAQELIEVNRTFYVKSQPKRKTAISLLWLFVRHPGVIFRGLCEAIRLAPWDLNETIYALFYLAEALLIGDWMRTKRCTHLHVHFSGPVASVGLLVSLAWKIPLSLTVHGPDEFFEVARFYLRRKIEQATFVVCISHFCRSQLLRLVSSANWDKLHVCRLGVDDTVFLPKVKSHSSPINLMCVGRLNASKGQAVLILAVESLIRKGRPLHIHFVGGGPERENLESLIAARGLQDAVTFHGATSHAKTRSLLSMADLFVLPSFAEGVPVALMEAMAMEIACISTTIAGIPELISSGEEGLLVAPSAVEELASAIDDLVTNVSRRNRFASAGRLKVLSNYNLARNVDQLADLFQIYGLGGKADG